MSKQLFVSRHLPKLSISVFNGDPLQYPVWKSAFNALVDSRPLEPDIKLNLLNPHVAGKRKQVAIVEHLSSDWNRRCVPEVQISVAGEVWKLQSCEYNFH